MISVVCFPLAFRDESHASLLPPSLIYLSYTCVLHSRTTLHPFKRIKQNSATLDRRKSVLVLLEEDEQHASVMAGLGLPLL
jgi:hypothetical protein